MTRSKRAVSRRAEPLQRARWPTSTRQQCLLADPLARHSTECAGCYQACLSPCAGCTALTDTSLAASFSRRGGLASVARERESDRVAREACTMSEMCGWLCRAARPCPGVHVWRRGLSPSTPNPNPSLCVVKETESGEARAALTIRDQLEISERVCERVCV